MSDNETKLENGCVRYNKTISECGCVRYTKTQENGEVFNNFCNSHYFANMTKEEYKTYWEKNKDRLNEKRRQRYKKNIETEKARNKEYREKNYEKVREREREKEQQETYKLRKQKYMEEYRLRPDRKQIEYERSTIPISCGCGGKYTSKSKSKHERTNKHTQWAQNPELQKQYEEERRREDEAQKQYEEERKREDKKKHNELWGSIEPLF